MLQHTHLVIFFYDYCRSEWVFIIDLMMALNECYSICYTGEAFGLKICESSPYIFA